MLTAAIECFSMSFESGTRSDRRVGSCSNVQIIDIYINTKVERGLNKHC